MVIMKSELVAYVCGKTMMISIVMSALRPSESNLVNKRRWLSNGDH